jgi:hypothetical protein
MKFFFLLGLVGLISCQEATTNKADERSIEKVSQVEDDMGLDKASFLLQTNIQGIQIAGENISKQGDLSVGENLKVVEASSEKVVDEFPLFDWGPVGFKTEDSSLMVFPKSKILEIDYKIDDKKKIVRTSKCTFNNRPEASRFTSILASAKGANPDWEGIFSGISQLAYEGNKKAYDFFLNPDAEAKSYLKNSDGAASIEPILKVLKYMKNNGCIW